MLLLCSYVFWNIYIYIYTIKWIYRINTRRDDFVQIRKFCYEVLYNFLWNILISFERGVVKNTNCSSCKVSCVFVVLELHLNILDRFSNYVQIPNFIKTSQVFHADGRTDRRQTDRHDETKSCFPQFCK